MNDCIFCRIWAKQVPTALLYESSGVIAFNDINPSAPVHILIVPRKHIPTFLDIGGDDSELLLQMIRAAQRLIHERKLEKGYRVAINGGRYQHVPHLHWHLISEERLP